MKVVEVRTSKEYSVIIEEGIMSRAGSLTFSTVNGNIAFIVTDSHVAPLYLESVTQSYEKVGYRVISMVIPAGEHNKNLETYAKCVSFMADNKMTRKDVVVALGGGVVGDIAGFCAATYMRGCRCVQIPTSLLAMVDSSVGGKTALDLPHGKNLIGAFYQPDLVCIDPLVLQSLDAHYFTDGCAEILKYGMLQGGAFARELKTPITPGDKRMENIVGVCLALKRGIVEDDEVEKGTRQLLNLGHTFGHAFEKLSGYTVSHGHAVACGLVVIAKVAARYFDAKPGFADEVTRVVAAYGLPQTVEECIGFTPSASEVYEAVLSDKKNNGTFVNLIIPRDFGQTTIEPVKLDFLKDIIEDIF